MTLQSLKRLRTILRNKPVWTASLSLAACAVLSSHASAQQPEVRRIPTTVPSSASLLGLEENGTDAPLERLKNRSAEDRWTGLNEKPAARQVEPLPYLPETNTLQLIPTETERTAQPTAPQLPDVRGIREFENLETPRLAPTPMFRTRPVVQSGPKMTPRGPEDSIPLPETVQSLQTIMPYADYDARNELYADEDVPPGVDLNEVPTDIAMQTAPLTPRLSPDTVFGWEASNLWHNPLYFEDPTLERYGHVASPLIQPLVSTGRFGLQLVGLPYQATIDPPRKKRYKLGWYQPGDVAPKLIYQIPLNVDAAAVQAGAVAAGIAILP